MEKAHISTYSELVSGITILKEEKRKQEDHLKRSVTEFTESLSPLSIIKGSMKKLAGNSDVQSGAATVGLNIGARFLIDQVFGGKLSIKGFLGSMLANNISSALINKGAPKIISAIGKMLHRKPEEKNTNTPTDQ